MSVHQKVEQSFVCLLPRVQQPCLSLWQIRHSLFVLAFCADLEKQTGQSGERRYFCLILKVP